MKTLDAAIDHVTDIEEDFQELHVILSNHANKYPGDKKLVSAMLKDVQVLTGSVNFMRIKSNMMRLLNASN
jgi:hypothetical protein